MCFSVDGVFRLLLFRLQRYDFFLIYGFFCLPVGGLFVLVRRAGVGEYARQEVDDVLVGREPLHGVERVGVEPAGSVVLFKGDAATAEAAEKAVHGEVEVGVVVVDGGEWVFDDYFGV